MNNSGTNFPNHPQYIHYNSVCTMKRLPLPPAMLMYIMR
jgi:hypothetical protein